MIKLKPVTSLQTLAFPLRPTVPYSKRLLSPNKFKNKVRKLGPQKEIFAHGPQFATPAPWAIAQMDTPPYTPLDPNHLYFPPPSSYKRYGLRDVKLSYKYRYQYEVDHDPSPICLGQSMTS